MTNSIHSAYTSEKAMQFVEKWEADRTAARYGLARTRNNGLQKDTLVKSPDIKPQKQQNIFQKLLQKFKSFFS